MARHVISGGGIGAASAAYNAAVASARASVTYQRSRCIALYETRGISMAMAASSVGDKRQQHKRGMAAIVSRRCGGNMAGRRVKNAWRAAAGGSRRGVGVACATRMAARRMAPARAGTPPSTARHSVWHNALRAFVARWHRACCGATTRHALHIMRCIVPPLSTARCALICAWRAVA